jgi:hypothetical protein
MIWVGIPCDDVVENQCFGVPCCLHLQVVKPYNNVAGYWRFGGPYCLHLQVVTPYNDMVGYQRFRGPCCLHLQVVKQCSDVVGYQRFGGSRCLHLRGEVMKLLQHSNISVTEKASTKRCEVIGGHSSNPVQRCDWCIQYCIKQTVTVLG